MKNKIREKQFELEMLSDLMSMVENNIRWNQHEDEQTGEVVDDTDEMSQIRLSAYRNVAKMLLKLAGV